MAHGFRDISAHHPEEGTATEPQSTAARVCSGPPHTWGAGSRKYRLKAGTGITFQNLPQGPMSIIQAPPPKTPQPSKQDHKLGTECLMHEPMRDISDFNHNVHVSFVVQK